MRVLLLVLGCLASSGALAMTEAARIEALITRIERLEGARFVRNGSEHDAAAAAAHLRLKWTKAGQRCATAESFIAVCASGSSLSGKPYLIRYADGREITSAEFLRAALAEL